MDIGFAHPLWLWGLLALPVCALVEWRAVTRARKLLRQLAGPRQPNALLAQLVPNAARTGVALRLAALALLALGAAGPQWGRETVRRTARGSDLVFAVDVSASMDTRDVAPSRIDEARREALALLDRTEGSRVAVLAFAGDAVRLCPLTLDHAAARLTLETISTSTVSTPGTDLGRALGTALRLLPAGSRDDQAIVLWTDGEDLEGHADAAVEQVRRSGVRVFTIGVGTAAGDVIPVRDERGEVVDVKHDENGATVRSRLDERLLRTLARTTRGAYFGATRSGGELSRLAAAMGALARTQRGARAVERPVARFAWFALLAGLALAAELLRARRRPAARRGVPAPARAAGRAAAAVVALALLAPHARAQTGWARGDDAFRAGRWAQAESLYAKRAKRGGPAAVQVNLATARAKLGKLAEVTRDLARLTAQPGRAGQAAGYNLGTLLGEKGDLEPALSQLRRALERDPNDADARWNYELLMRQREEQQKKQSQQQQKPEPQKAPDQPQPGQQGGSGPGQGQAPQPPAPQPPARNPNPGQQPPPQPMGQAGGMSRGQAEQLLGSLRELERLERQQQRRGHAMTERRGKDW